MDILKHSNKSSLKLCKKDFIWCVEFVIVKIWETLQIKGRLLQHLEDIKL